MDLTLILGPMASGKSHEFISVLSPLRYARTTHAVYQSARHVRDDEVTSRTGGRMPTIKVHALDDVLTNPVEVCGIDEVHMFTRGDIAAVATLLASGTRVVASGLDLDHRGQLFDSVKALLELGPASVVYRRAVCLRCREGVTATHTQVLAGGTPYLEQLGSSEALPDDGTFTYEPTCRTCFVYPS